MRGYVCCMYLVLSGLCVCFECVCMCACVLSVPVLSVCVCFERMCACVSSVRVLSLLPACLGEFVLSVCACEC